MRYSSEKMGIEMIFADKKLTDLFVQIEQGIDNTPSEKIGKNFNLIGAMRSVVETYGGASNPDKSLIEEALVNCIETIRKRGASHADSFTLVRNLSHALDKEAEGSTGELNIKFSERLAHIALGAFSDNVRSQIDENGGDPQEEVFNAIAIARIQTTGTVGRVFRTAYEDGLPLYRPL